MKHDNSDLLDLLIEDDSESYRRTVQMLKDSQRLSTQHADLRRLDRLANPRPKPQYASFRDFVIAA